MQFIKVSVLFLALLLSVHSFAGGGGGEASKPADPGVPESEKEYMDKTMKMNLAWSRIQEAEQVFKELVEKKKKAKTPTEREAILKEMVEVSKTRNREVDVFNKTRSDIDLRYPNQGKHLDGMYKTQQRRSVQELENTSSLDGRLTDIHRRVRAKFAPLKSEGEEEKASTPAVPAEKPKPKRLRLEK